MIIRPAEVHENSDKARLGVGLACEALDLKCDMRLQTMWVVTGIDGNDVKTFIEMARECAETG